MRFAAILVAVGLLYAGNSSAESGGRIQDDQVLARLSYQNGYGADWREREDSPRICFALYRDGYYKLFRVKQYTNESVEGMLPRDNFARINKLLKELDSDINRGGVVLRGSESFNAEIISEKQTIHFVWVDPDHERPFPDSVKSIVKWLQDFKPNDASPLTIRELSNQPICPHASGKPLEPKISRLEGSPIPDGCGK